MSRKGGTGEGVWVHPKGVNSMAVLGFHCKRPWLVPGGPFPSFLAQKQAVLPCRAPISALESYLLRMAEITCGSPATPGNRN